MNEKHHIRTKPFRYNHGWDVWAAKATLVIMGILFCLWAEISIDIDLTILILSTT